MLLFLTAPATTEFYTLSLHDALPISRSWFGELDARDFICHANFIKLIHHTVSAGEHLLSCGRFSCFRSQFSGLLLQSSGLLLSIRALAATTSLIGCTGS